MGASLTVKDAYSLILKEYPDVMNIEQMCSALGISTKTGYQLLKEGQVLCLKIGRSYRIPKAHLLTYLRIRGESN
ncbi:MAG: helix-turn-helix domain-containing protein [Clostridiales bacterium]|jgi:excisionase family DNA binding protein|nr:helix-turn-helix domain-containing protein [Clostridiales bacterium]